MWTVQSQDPAETAALGRALARVVPEQGIVVALVGPLGAGKTALAQGVGEGLQVTEPVVSPTFVLVTEHDGSRPMLHADLYRLDAGDLLGIGLEEQLEAWPGIALVEWADRFPEVLPDDHLRVVLEVADGARSLQVSGTGPRGRAVAAAWQREARGGR